MVPAQSPEDKTDSLAYSIILFTDVFEMVFPPNLLTDLCICTLLFTS